MPSTPVNEWEGFLDEAEALSRGGFHAHAVAMAENALRLAGKMFGSEHVNYAICLTSLGRIHFDNKEYVKAERYYCEAMTAWIVQYGREHHKVAACMSSMGDIYSAQKLMERASVCYDQAVILYKRLYGPRTMVLARCLHRYASIYDVKSDFSKAFPLLKEELGIYEAMFGSNHPFVLDCMSNLYDICMLGGAQEEAEKFAKQLQLSEYKCNDIFGSNSVLLDAIS